MPYKGKVVADVGAFHAPYIPLFLQDKEKKKPTMFIKLRKRFINWLRETDGYGDDGRMLATDEEPIKVRADREVASWSNAVNVMNNAKSRKVARTLGAVMKSSPPERAESIDSRGITFKLFPARGGLVIETYHYDDRTDSNQNTLHLIAESEDLSEALSRIISMEAMRTQQ
jgi:hypothetical protein